RSQGDREAPRARGRRSGGGGGGGEGLRRRSGTAATRRSAGCAGADRAGGGRRRPRALRGSETSSQTRREGAGGLGRVFHEGPSQVDHGSPGLGQEEIMAALDGFLRTLWLACGRHLWESTLVLALLFVLGSCLRSAPGRLQSAFWSAALAKLFLPL